MRVARLVVGLALAATLAQAEQLPFKSYGTTDGLPSTFVVRITRDSRGFLWFATRDGLARFDGSRFVTYGMEQGLPVPTLNQVLETRDGMYWVATNGGGVYRLAPDVPLSVRPGGPNPWRAYRLGDGYADRVNILHEDAAGRIWAGSDGGIFVLERRTDPAFRALALPEIGVATAPLGINALVEDPEGGLWIGASRGLFRRRPSGRFVHYPLLPASQPNGVRGLVRDGQGRMWVASERGLLAFVPEPLSALPADAETVHALERAPDEPWPDGPPRALPERPGEARWYRLGAGQPPLVQAVCVTADQHVWVGVARGALRELADGRWRTFTAANGVADDTVNAITEDRDGNLWIASRSAGVMKLTRGGFTRYSEDDGLTPSEVHSFYQDASGHLFVVSGDWVLSRFDGVRFTSVRPRGRWATGPWASEIAWLDRTGGWWLLTGDGLGRLPRVARFTELADRSLDVLYGPRNGVPHALVSHVFEDRHGDLWASGRSNVQVGLARWERATGRWHTYSEKEGLPTGQAPGAFVEDAGGTLWIGLLHGGLMRYRDGRFEPVPQQPPLRALTTAYRDDAGDLWIGSSQEGLLRVMDATSDRPRFVRYTTAEGLASNNVRCLTSDQRGRLYVGTVRGVDRLDPATGQVLHYTTADGLANSFVTAAFRDRSGALWFGTMYGLSRLVPMPDRPRSSPPVWIDAVRVNGVPRPVAHLGQASVRGLELRPDESQVEIEYFGLGFGLGESLRYQYRLLGADQDWSRPGEGRSVHYARLAPGRYDFRVRAVTADGLASAQSADVEFTVVPPLWRRAWFQASLAALIALLVYVVHRRSLAHALALERVRTRIASDLHDDIGASLSQIAILGEVVSARLDGQRPELLQPLTLIGTLSREAVDSMSDIVWAINPLKDRLPDLAHRMRRVASELLPARQIAFEFRVAETAREPKLGADVRREVFLVFKEALNNAVRHSGCAKVEIELRLEGSWMVLEVRDDGRGLAPEQVGQGLAPERAGGHGLTSMRRRAESVGGRLDISSGPGTRVTLRVPLRHHAPSRPARSA